MLNIFEDTTASESALHPRNNPDVLTCESTLRAAQERADPAQKAWRDYVIAHADESTAIPFSREKQRLYYASCDTAEAVQAAEAALRIALDTATVKAKAGWDLRVQHQFLDDLPAIEAFITLLERHEQLVIEAQLAGVSHVLSVSTNFLTSAEVAARLAYAKRALGLE